MIPLKAYQGEHAKFIHVSALGAALRLWDILLRVRHHPIWFIFAVKIQFKKPVHRRRHFVANGCGKKSEAHKIYQQWIYQSVMPSSQIDTFRQVFHFYLRSNAFSNHFQTHLCTIERKYLTFSIQRRHLMIEKALKVDKDNCISSEHFKVSEDVRSTFWYEKYLIYFSNSAQYRASSLLQSKCCSSIELNIKLRV